MKSTTWLTFCTLLNKDKVKVALHLLEIFLLETLWRPHVTIKINQNWHLEGKQTIYLSSCIVSSLGPVVIDILLFVALSEYDSTSKFLESVKSLYWTSLRWKPSPSSDFVALKRDYVDSAVVATTVFLTAIYDLKYKFTKSQINSNLLKHQVAINKAS